MYFSDTINKIKFKLLYHSKTTESDQLIHQIFTMITEKNDDESNMY